MACIPLPLCLLLLGLLHQVLAEVCEADICEYKFIISMQHSLVYKAPEGPPGYFDVELRGKDLFVTNSTFRPKEIFPQFVGQKVPDPLEIITLDGFKRNIFTINGQFPGPTLEVMEGAEVVVHVENKLHDQEVTFHWHGLPQRLNAWMDGVPGITQCAIPKGHSFTYRFKAIPAGTFWYHSHFGYQRICGLAGALLIHASKPTVPYFPVLIQDWYHQEGQVYWSTHPLSTPSMRGAGGKFWNYFAPGYAPFQVDGTDVSLVRYVSGLINGRGRFKPSEKWPLTEFKVEKGKRHLFRVINVAGEMPLEVSIDGHKLTVVSVDGLDVEPETVDSVILYPAERADVEMVTNLPVGKYWMRSRLLKDDSQDGKTMETLAIVSYVGSRSDQEPYSQRRICSEQHPCRAFNCPFKYYPDIFHTTCIHVTDLKRKFTSKERFESGLDKIQPDEEFFLNLNFNRGASFNTKNFIYPTAPVYQTDSVSIGCDDCPADNACGCTHRLFLPFNKVIQLVISNLSPQNGSVQAHPIHLHGHHFAVVKQAFPDFNYGDPAFSVSKTPNTDVVCDDEFCRNAYWKGGKQPVLNLRDPPLKETIVVPPSGYVVLRFRSDNPGPWLLHCHYQNHRVQGPMTVLIMEAEDRFPPVPPNMPTCSHNFSLSDDEYFSYRHSAQQAKIKARGFKKVSPTSQHYLPWINGQAHLKQASDQLSFGLASTIALSAAGVVGGFLIAVAIFTLLTCRRRSQVASK